MSYRDDHDAAIARADAAVREAAQLAAENERLTAELAAAKEWLGGPRKRAMLLGAIVLTALGLGAAGLAIGRCTVEPVVIQPPPPKIYPKVVGVVFADGPEVGHWMMKATRCIPREIGVELTSVGKDDHSVGIIGNDVEIETPTGALTLERTHCRQREVSVRKNDRDPTAWDGFVDLDCRFRDNMVHGYVEFENCK